MRGAQAELRSVSVRTPLLNGLGMQFAKSVTQVQVAFWRRQGHMIPSQIPLLRPELSSPPGPVPRVLFPIRRSGFPAGAYPNR